MPYAPPSLCRADALQVYMTVRPQADSVVVNLGLYADGPCLLPTRPAVQLVVSGRRITVKREPLVLTGKHVPRTTIAPRQPATAVLRWRNWCGVHGPVVLVLTLGGVSLREDFGSANTHGPPCVSASTPSTLQVSRFVAR